MASAVAASAILVAFTVSPGEAGARSGPNLHRFEFARPAMGTVARVIVYAPDVDRAAAAAARAFDRIMALERVFSDYRADSEARRLAAKPPNAWHPVGADLFRLLARAQAIAEASGGAFDVTAGSVFAVWRRARRLAEPPDTAALAAARAAGGFRRLDLDPHHRRVRLRARGMRLDFGGIAKGDAANEALRVLRASGLPRALVAIGGDLAAGDPPPDRAAWRIDVDPGTPGAVLPPLELSNAAVSTSSGAEQFVTLGGVRYSHIVDPRTGEALRVGRAVVAIAPDGATADALATAISVLGPDEGLRLADAEPGAAALVLEAADGRVARAASSRWPARGWASRVRRDPDQQ